METIKKGFDVHTELASLKAQTQLQRKSRYKHSRSKLDRFYTELLSLHEGGASTSELQRWLKSHALTVSYSTVFRWLDKHCQCEKHKHG